MVMEDLYELDAKRREFLKFVRNENETPFLNWVRKVTNDER